MLDGAVGYIGILQSRVINILTILGVLLTPPVLVASVYGMNFKHMPELDWTWGYAWALGLMVVSAIVMYVIASDPGLALASAQALNRATAAFILRRHREEGCSRAGRQRWRSPLCSRLRLAHADEVADFYRGKQIDLIVGYGPSGGYDIYARLLARHFGRFIPGNPNVIVQNMPGAGSLRAVNYLYNAAPKDGTTIGMFSRNMPLIGLLGGNPNVQFEPRKLTWLGSSSSFVNDAYILIVRKDAPVKSIDEARRRRPSAARARRQRRKRDRQRRADHPARHHRSSRQAGRGLSRQHRDLSRDRARRGARTHRRSVLGEIDEARMAQAGQRLSRAGSVRANDPPSGFPRRAHGAGAREERGGAGADRAGGAALHAVAAVRGAARCPRGPRQGAAARVPRRPQRCALSGGCRRDSEST